MIDFTQAIDPKAIDAMLASTDPIVMELVERLFGS